ncbi:plant/protein (DUF789) [Rhynchospora pubera]|uniref:Plant/protein (DUF789) n=1 Tax=Rhynchospora pubera TaxID=906938 RepID=A0AAV8CYJ8_9POAL|nr:plant/protein (DUF789) [Rhynchospora pubera]KAJ4759582.1 plant/protein (DUF789) [Rhynchospora pubera]KAJ4812056.1 plant/protein (DUF789) [Rhynchospora pubera]
MAINLENHSNLQCFLDCTTPIVKTQNFPKSGFLKTNLLSETPGPNPVKCFQLADLWDQYYEWSACGAGTRVHLYSGDTVVQYYVPYLSAIQLYTTTPRSFNGGTGVYYQKENIKRLGELYFEYFEACSPYGRIPFYDKIYELAHDVPGLTSLTSLELSPASWMAVAWYPIYHIPTRCNVKELSACFLTYHTISSLFQDDEICKKEEVQCCKKQQFNKTSKFTALKTTSMSLPPFGLATYKVKGSLWLNSERGDKEMAASLYSAADSWLKQLAVQHHDFTYFTTHTV